MDLNNLIMLKGIDPKNVLVFRHRPQEPSLRRVFNWLIVERPSVFNAYQQAHAPKTESALKQAEYVVSFVGNEAKKAVFVAIYKNNGYSIISKEEFWNKEENNQLRQLGMRGPDDNRAEMYWFDLIKTDIYSEWSGRLLVNWPGLEKSWYRWAYRNSFPIHAIATDSQLIQDMPSWHDLILTYNELLSLPGKWRDALRQWRGIYLIFDKAEKKSYVGSAYGKSNILGRWEEYAITGHGNNVELKKLDPQNFEFSILQRLSPDMGSDEIIAVESSWKKRLHTFSPYGLNKN